MMIMNTIRARFSSLPDLEASRMIVFSGPTTTTIRYYYDDEVLTPTERSIPPAELAQRHKVNLSDLANITTDVLCRLQHLYINNQSQDEWVWELTNVNISDIVDALGLDGYIALSDVIMVPSWFKAFITVLFISCLLWSGASNLRTVIAISISKSSCSSTNALIGALALSDLLTVTCTTPTEVSSVIHDLPKWDFGSFGCVTFPFLQSTAILCNALILCLIAYDRYVCVVKLKPFAMTTKATWKVVVSVIVALIVSMVISLPAFWLWRVYYYIVVDDLPDPEFGMDFCSVFPVCTANRNLPPKELPIYHILLCGAIFVPLFVLFAILYCRIGYFLWSRTSVGVGDNNTAGQLERKKRVVWALFWLIFTFFICRMPNWIFVMVTMFSYPEPTAGLEMLKSSLIFLSVFNTALNPWLYSRLNESLRKTKMNCMEHVCELINCCSACRQQDPVEEDRPSIADNDSDVRHQNQTPQVAHRRHRQVEPIMMEVELDNHHQEVQVRDNNTAGTMTNRTTSSKTNQWTLNDSQ